MLFPAVFGGWSYGDGMIERRLRLLRRSRGGFGAGGASLGPCSAAACWLECSICLFSQRSLSRSTRFGCLLFMHCWVECPRALHLLQRGIFSSPTPWASAGRPRRSLAGSFGPSALRSWRSSTFSGLGARIGEIALISSGSLSTCWVICTRRFGLCGGTQSGR